MKVRISVGLRKLTDTTVSEFASHIVASLTGNTNYQNPYPVLANITTLNTQYMDALVKSVGGSKTDKSYKNELRAELKAAITLLSRYAEDNCQNNETILLSSGFALRKSNTAIALPAVPENVLVKDGNLSGEVKVTYGKTARAKSYLARYTVDLNSGIWKFSNSSTRTKIGISDLEVGKVIWVQVRAVNSAGYSEWSNPTALIVR